MPSNFPKDRFDTLPTTLARVGAHRAPVKKGRRWIPFWSALAATIILIGAGVVTLFVLNDRLNFTLPGTSTISPSVPTATPPAAVPTAEATLDPSLSVTVLNGTAGAGVAANVSDVLTAAGWRVGATSNANTEDVPTTTVYYSDPAAEGAALGVASSLPGSTVLLSSDFADSGAALTVVVGNDYVPPAE